VVLCAVCFVAHGKTIFVNRAAGFGVPQTNGWSVGAAAYPTLTIVSGDVLSFRWTGLIGDHTVTRVDQNTATNCPAVPVLVAPVLATVTAAALVPGTANVFEVLVTPATPPAPSMDYYFISTTAGDCAAGMHVKVTVLTVGAQCAAATGVPNQLNWGPLVNNVIVPPMAPVSATACLGPANVPIASGVACTPDSSVFCPSPAADGHTYLAVGSLNCHNGLYDDGLVACQITSCTPLVDSGNNNLNQPGVGNVCVGPNVPVNTQCSKVCANGLVSSGFNTCIYTPGSGTAGAWVLAASCVAQCPLLTTVQLDATITNGNSGALGGCPITAGGATCANVACVAGWTLIGTLTCSSIGAWSFPQCVQQCTTTPLAVTNAVTSPSSCLTTNTGSVCTLTCATGFTKNSDWTCMFGTWSTPLCTSVASGSCIADPAAVVWGIPVCGLIYPVSPGSTCPLLCAPGYIPTGQFVCSGGLWNSPQCVLPSQSGALARSIIAPIVAMIMIWVAVM